MQKFELIFRPGSFQALPGGMRRVLLRLPLVLLVLVLSACAPSTADRQRFFWPPGPDEPRIEYINFYQNDHHVRRDDDAWLADAIFGKTRPQRIFDRPKDIASDGRGRVIVTDLAKRAVFVFDFVRHEVRTLEDADGATRVFSFPVAVAMDEQGSTYVLNMSGDSNVIYVYDNHEEPVRTIVPSELKRPVGLAVDAQRNRFYVTDSGTHRLLVYDMNGTLLQAIGEHGDGPGQFNFPLDVDFDEEGNIYVVDAMNARIQVFDAEGGFVRSFGERGTQGGAFNLAKSIAVSPFGHIYVVDSRAHRFLIFDREGNYLLSVGGHHTVGDDGVAPGGFSLPQGIDVDQNGAIWVVDSLNRMFHQFQYLSASYLAEHPILPGQTFFPPGFYRGGEGRPD